MADDKKEIAETLAKVLMAVGSIGMALIAKIAFDSRNNALTWKAIIVKSVMGIFAGFITTVYLIPRANIYLIGAVVPVATLLGESLMIWLMTNWKSVLSRYFPGLFRKEDQE